MTDKFDKQLNKIIDEEIDKAADTGIKCTVGEALTVVCKSAIRMALGDERFNKDLNDVESDDEYEAVMREAMWLLRRKIDKMLQVPGKARV